MKNDDDDDDDDVDGCRCPAASPARGPRTNATQSNDPRRILVAVNSCCVIPLYEDYYDYSLLC